MDRLTVPGTMPTLVADLTCAVNGSYTENYIRALCGRAAEALQSLSQEAVRDEALEEIKNHALDESILPRNRLQGVVARLEALKREPNAAASACAPPDRSIPESEPFTDAQNEEMSLQAAQLLLPEGYEIVKPAPAAPDVASMVKRLEDYYDFQCEGGPLKNCVEWMKIKEALLAKLGQGWVPSARFSWGPGGMVADPKGGYVWVDIPKLCADCLQPEYCGRNGCIQPAPGASDV